MCDMTIKYLMLNIVHFLTVNPENYSQKENILSFTLTNASLIIKDKNDIC